MDPVRLNNVYPFYEMDPVLQVEVKIKPSPSVQNISSETTVKKGSGETDKTDSEETESVNPVNNSVSEKEGVVLLVKASPAIVVDPAEKGEQYVLACSM